MPITRTLNLITVQSWTYLTKQKAKEEYGTQLTGVCRLHSALRKPRGRMDRDQLPIPKFFTL